MKLIIDKLQKYYGQESLQLHYGDTDSMVLSMKTKDIVQDLNEFKNVAGLLKIETLKNIWSDKFICLRSKVYAFITVNDSDNMLKGNEKCSSKEI